ncbi:serine hydrolase domain-containing protein [Nocardioides stalactiti]|uniref:serine hydrolase domain-containing protein n=1 Tax=Nocardioides stalactiti TaxID=2755356 RepID=UPI001602CFB0|nr:serine hydrolase domain-containing protein [Nocardioides stalactiti]
MTRLRPPRLPAVPDPMRRVRVPRDLEAVTTVAEEADPGDVGMTRDGVERIWKDARNLYRSGIHPALTLCVRRHGEVVLDRAIGHARGNGPKDDRSAEKVLVTPETPLCIFSATKGITASLIHLLDERGVLHVGDRIADYLPDFARNGKGGITVGQVLSHRAGIPNLPSGSLDLDRIGDVDFKRELMYDARPMHRPGKRQAYHAVSGGEILAEVVREVTGRSIRDVLAEEILDPLGFRWTNYGVAAEDVDQVALNYPTGPPLLPPVSTVLTRALGLHPDEATRVSNDPRFLQAVMPAANGVSTANELSRFYELLRNGGELDGTRIMEARTIRRARVEQSHLEVDFSLGLPIGFSMGYMLGGRMVSLFGPDTPEAFGHLGWVNILSWADPQRALSVALITTGKAAVYPEITRFLQVPRRIGKEAAKV